MGPRELAELYIKVQIPIIICLALISSHAYKVLEFKEMKFFFLGWLANLIYLLFKLFSIDEEQPIYFLIETFLDLACSFCFVLVFAPSFTKLLKKSWLRTYLQRHYRIRYTFFATLLLGALIIKSIPRTEDLIPFLIVRNFPAVVINSAVLYFLGLFFVRFKGEYSNSKYLCWSLFFYAGIQWLDLIERTSFQEHSFWYNNIDDIGFFLGLIAKLFILISLYGLVVQIVKSIASVKTQLENKSLFAEKLNQILGRTFHEIVPPLLEIENQTAILSDDSNKYDIQVSKKVRREIDKIEGDVYRIKTILSAASKMYYVDTLHINPSTENGILPLQIEEETDVHNVNMLVEIAITNFRTTVAILKNPQTPIKDPEKNFYVTNEIKFTTEYAKNCNVYGNSVEIVQIFYNLFKNSYEALADSDKICNIFIKTKNIFEELEGTKSKRILIEVEDNGPGIRSEVLENIYNEGFSTRKDQGGRGRGYGLKIIKANVQKHYGIISVESPIEEPRVASLDGMPGTKFCISLPKIKVEK